MESRCPITYVDTSSRYSQEGIKKIFGRLKSLEDLSFDIEEAMKRLPETTEGWSLPGDLYKIPVNFQKATGSFQIQNIPDKFFLKFDPSNSEFIANEDLSLKIAKVIGIETVNQGMIFGSQGTLLMWLQRFDRFKGRRLYMENFAQLSGYASGPESPFLVELPAKIIRQYCTFPMVESERFLRRVLLAYLIGFHRVHLNKFSLIKDQNSVVRLSPLYGFRSTMLYDFYPSGNDLLLNGKSQDWNQRDFFEYLAFEQLQLSMKSVQKIKGVLSDSSKEINELIERSFLSPSMKLKFQSIFYRRSISLGL